MRAIDPHELRIKVYHCGANPEVDILAVHGLGAHPDDTWCFNLGQEYKKLFPDEDASTGQDDDGLVSDTDWPSWVKSRRSEPWLNWLEDKYMLPATFESSRIMRYGYLSDWKGEGRVVTRPTVISQELLEELVAKREEDTTRPIIFIAHSYGGLVALQTLIDAMEKHSDIYAATIGLIFIGVPFRGASDDFTYGIPDLAKQELGGNQVWDYAWNVQKDDGQRADLRHKFFAQAIERGLPSITCFWEKMPTDVARVLNHKNEYESNLLCPPDSACLDVAKTVPMDCDHFSMNKFSWPKDKHYESMVREIRQMLKDRHKVLRYRRMPHSQAKLNDILGGLGALTALNAHVILGKRSHDDAHALFAETMVHGVLYLLTSKITVDFKALRMQEPEIEDAIIDVVTQIKNLVTTLMALETKLHEEDVLTSRWKLVKPEDLVMTFIQASSTLDKFKDILDPREDELPQCEADDLEQLKIDLRWAHITWQHYLEFLWCIEPEAQRQATGLAKRVETRRKREDLQATTIKTKNMLAREGMTWEGTTTRDEIRSSLPRLRPPAPVLVSRDGVSPIDDGRVSTMDDNRASPVKAGRVSPMTDEISTPENRLSTELLASFDFCRTKHLSDKLSIRDSTVSSRLSTRLDVATDSPETPSRFSAADIRKSLADIMHLTADRSSMLEEYPLPVPEPLNLRKQGRFPV